MLFAFYTFSMEVESWRQGAWFMVFAVCSPWEFSVLVCEAVENWIQSTSEMGSGKYSTVSPGVVHLKFLFQSLKANKSAEKCRISGCLFKKEKKNVKGIAKIFTFITKQAIFRFQTKPLLFFPHSRYHYGRQLQRSWEEPKYTEYLKYIFLLLTFWLFTSWTLC